MKIQLLALATIGMVVAPACVVSAASSPKAPAPRALLAAMERAEATVSFSASERVMSKGGAVETRRVYRSGRKRRIEWLAPSLRRGDLMVDDGTNVWLYHRSENSATQTRSAPSRPGRRLAGLGKTYTARVVGAETVNGRSAWKLEIETNSRARRVWVDQATAIAVRRQALEPGGAIRQGSELRDLRVGSIAASLFSWRPPVGAKITLSEGRLFSSLAGASRNCAWLQSPRALPAGFAFESAIVDTKNGESWLRYSNGLHRFSIFQQKVNDSAVKAGRSIPDGGFYGYYWQRGGSRFLVAGLPPQQASVLAIKIR